MLKLFLDTNILVSASFWQGASHRLLNEIKERHFIGFTTAAVLGEYKKVIQRDFNFSEIEADARIFKFLEILLAVNPTEAVKVVKDDPDDDKILEGALAASANFIVSYDRHLLDLSSFEGIKVLKPEEVLKKLESS